MSGRAEITDNVTQYIYQLNIGGDRVTWMFYADPRLLYVEILNIYT
jgi:hypothetical protein